MKISWFDSATNVDDAVANAERARAAGCHRYWSPQISNADPMVVLGIVGFGGGELALGDALDALEVEGAHEDGRLLLLCRGRRRHREQEQGRERRSHERRGGGVHRPVRSSAGGWDARTR